MLNARVNHRDAQAERVGKEDKRACFGHVLMTRDEVISMFWLEPVMTMVTARPRDDCEKCWRLQAKTSDGSANACATTLAMTKSVAQQWAPRTAKGPEDATLAKG
ncbi:hypothetical protein FGB62_407g06 [Gracilaria domingensis]|nr:hypothetical protein FGB62_407g06 [Gracilaria domingensis]